MSFLFGKKKKDKKKDKDGGTPAVSPGSGSSGQDATGAQGRKIT